MKVVCLLIIGIIILTALLILWAATGTLSTAIYTSGRLEKEPSSITSEEKLDLHVMTANLGFCGGVDGLAGVTISKEESLSRLEGFISALPKDLDILAIQEIDEFSKRSSYIDQVTLIAETAGFAYRAIAYTWDKRWIPYPLNAPFSQQFGPTRATQVVFSKYPIRRQKILRFSKPTARPFWENWFYIDRLTQFLEIDHPTLGQINLAHSHFEAFDTTARELQIASVEERLNNKHWQGKSLLLGDVNSNLIVEKHFQKQGFKEVGDDEKLGGTYPIPNPTERLDGIWFSKDWILDHVEVWKPQVLLSGKITDHYPIYAILKISK